VNMNKLAFGLILGGTIFAPLEITKCVIRDIPRVSYIALESWIMELSFIWIGYIVAVVVLALTLLRQDRGRGARP